jgi:transketolase
MKAALKAYIDGLLAARKRSRLARRAKWRWSAITPLIPEMVGGSADLTGSNNTKTKATTPFGPSDYSGRYVYYGIREFGMAAAMNGMALHGGVIPYGGTFLVFSDYCRNAIRMSALQRQRVVYVLTHDSIGLGEDGPTHQPIEHIMSMRMIPNLEVYPPVRRGRDRRVLGAGAQEREHAIGVGAYPSEPAAAAYLRGNAERQGRLSPARCHRRRAQGGARGYRLRGRDRGQDGRGARSPGDRR